MVVEGDQKLCHFFIYVQPHDKKLLSFLIAFIRPNANAALKLKIFDICLTTLMSRVT